MSFGKGKQNEQIQKEILNLRTVILQAFLNFRKQ